MMKRNNRYLDIFLILLGMVSIWYFSILCTKIYFSYLLIIYPVFSIITIGYGCIELYTKKNILYCLPTWLRQTMLTTLTIGLSIFLIVEGIIIYHSHSSTQQASDYIIVLGAKVNGTTPSKSLRYRLDATITYLEISPNATIIVSGGQGAGEEDSEANVMKQYLINHGVNENQIITEDKSTNTVENLTFSKQIMDKQKENYTVTIITNGFHTYRAKYIANHLDIDARTYSAKEDSYSVVHYYLRECFGVVKEWITL